MTSLWVGKMLQGPRGPLGSCIATRPTCPRPSRRTWRHARTCEVPLEHARRKVAVKAAASNPLEPRPQRQAGRSSPPPAHTRTDRYQTRLAETASSLPNYTVSILVKEINKQIGAAKSLQELRDIYYTSASEFNTVCLATVGPAWSPLS